MIKQRYRWVVMPLVIFFTVSCYAQTDTIRLKDNQLVTSALQPGLRQYLVYFQDPKKNKSLNCTFWLRDIRIENKNGKKVFTITQNWYGGDTASYRAIYSINNMADFAPIYHSEIVHGKTRAYNWYNDKITGVDSVPANLQKGFTLNFKSPNFNWNLDIETFEMLPLVEGKTFVINFYDAGLGQPEYIKYKVTGSEMITTLNNQKVDCWKLYTEGELSDKSPFSETYWISKKGHEFLKEEDAYNGMFRYKIKMIGSAPDLIKRFNN